MAKHRIAKKKKPMSKKKSTVGRLIKGMTKKLPSDILKNPVFKKRLKEMTKDYSGIYALYKGNKLIPYYVGLTGNLYGRIGWHTKDRHAGKWDKFIIFRIKKINYLKDIETLIHNIVPTLGGKNIGRVPKDADLNEVIREIAREHKKELKEIEKAIK